MQEPGTDNRIHFTNFKALGQSTDPLVRSGYGLLTTVLDQIFGKHEGTIIIDNKVETEQMEQIIRMYWQPLKKCFHLSPHLTRNKKIVRQVLKHIIDYLNENDTFVLDEKITFARSKTYIHSNATTTAYSFTTVSL